MNQPPNTTTLRGPLPAIGEFFRAISGLVAIVALLGIVLSSFAIGHPDAGQLFGAASMVDGTTAAPARDPASQPAPPPSTKTMTFYVVATPEQEFDVDWSENVDATDLHRDYRVFYARDDAELQAVQHAVLEYMFGQSDASLIRFIDLRSVGD